VAELSGSSGNRELVKDRNPKWWWDGSSDGVAHGHWHDDEDGEDGEDDEEEDD
jgi:hypothetical protein